MTPQQQAAIEQAAKEYINILRNEGWGSIMLNHAEGDYKEGAREICTNPEKYELVSMKKHKEQIKANLYYRKLYQIAISHLGNATKDNSTIPLSEALEFAEWMNEHVFPKHVNNNGYIFLSDGHIPLKDVDVYTTAQLWEEFKKQKS